MPTDPTLRDATAAQLREDAAVSNQPCNCDKGYGCFTVLLVWLFAYSCGVDDGRRSYRNNPTHARCVTTTLEDAS